MAGEKGSFFPKKVQFGENNPLAPIAGPEASITYLKKNSMWPWGLLYVMNVIKPDSCYNKNLKNCTGQGAHLRQNFPQSGRYTYF